MDANKLGEQKPNQSTRRFTDALGRMTTTVGIDSATHPCPPRGDFAQAPPTHSTSYRRGGMVQLAQKMSQLTRAKHAPPVLPSPLAQVGSHRIFTSSWPPNALRPPNPNPNRTQILTCFKAWMISSLVVFPSILSPSTDRPRELFGAGQHDHRLCRPPTQGSPAGVPPFFDKKMANARALLGIGLLVGAASAFVAPAPGQMALSRARRGSLLASSPSLSTPFASFSRHGLHAGGR